MTDYYAPHVFDKPKWIGGKEYERVTDNVREYLQAVPDDVFHEAQKVILHREDNMAHRIAKQIADDAQERLFKALDWFYGDRVSGHVEESRESAVKVCDIMVEILGHEHFRRRFLGERKLEQEEEVGDL